ncbi:MAG: ATP-grasp domain-containing protein [Proteobacteria bacterium]|nr:ATP-grasp domain-containing protein [Pseudomonadota bacterium]
MRRIHKVLIANRGEIAIRVIRTCRNMGIATVAVFSDADEAAPHVEWADEAVRIGPPPAVESYLVVERIIAAARRTGADAIHPGYGFLAENADFARACADAGIIFIGPSAEVIGRLGSKRESRRIARKAGVPVIPGHDGSGEDGEESGRDRSILAAQAVEIGFPVLLKASAGGGGKGMRIVREASQLDTAIESAMREARSSFGDDTMLVEQYIDRPRHIEFQVLADDHGNAIHLFERECSIQRRHQKIIEETPSPALDDELRERMGAAAVAMIRAVDYRNAGTVEFILAPDRQFYFLEVNTRLQVEHPITECITGIDLVREQIRIAQGEPIEVGEPTPTGAAIECRLYAEDPASGFLPTSGRLLDWYLPGDLDQAHGVRLDSGVIAGQDIGIHYDPMLAKLICHAPSRDEAIRKMIYALGAMSIQGLLNNRDFLIQLLSHPAFQSGELDTHFIDRHSTELLVQPQPRDRVEQWARDAAVAAALAGHEARRSQRKILPDMEPGFRNNRYADERIDYELADGTAVLCDYRPLARIRGRSRFHVEVAIGDREPQSAQITVIAWRDPELIVEDDSGWRRRFRVIAADGRVFVHAGQGSLSLRELPRFPEVGQRDVRGGLVAPMPGKVVKVLVSPGQSVQTGDTVAVLEAMKMEHPVAAPHDGIVAEIAIADGDQVEADALIAVVAPAEGSSTKQ